MTAANRALPSSRSWLIGVLLIACTINAVSCRDAGQRAERSPAPAVAAAAELRNDRACSDVQVTRGAAETKWLVKPASDTALSSAPGISSTDIARAPDGTVYVLDRFEARVVQLDTTGRVLGTFGTTGDGPGEFRRPRAIAARQNEVYVADEKGLIHGFSRTGQFIQSVRVPPDFRVLDDVAVFPSGKLAVAKTVWSHETKPWYVAIINPAGTKVRDLRRVNTEPGVRVRPLLAPVRNPVQLAFGHGTLVVWYPLDNYLELFDSAGAHRSTMAGCLPASITAFYERQEPGPRRRQAEMPVTVGVAIEANGIIRVATAGMSGSTPLLRIRHYDPAKAEAQAREYEIPEGGGWNRAEFLDSTSLLLFNSLAPEAGILMVRLR